MSGYAGQHVWLIGAGDGIGRALALELASLGATLILSGRNRDKLDALNGTLGGKHAVLPLDVTNAEAAKAAVELTESLAPRLDRVIFLAGQYQPMALDALDTDIARTIVETNLLGAINVIAAVLPRLLKQKFGQIALCGSVSGYIGLPKSQPYAATKAGIVNLAESLRVETGRRGIDVRLISPGFVRTRLTDKNAFHMPAMLEPDEAARRIAKGLEGRAFEIHFPRRISLLLKLLALLPRGLYFRLVKL